MLKIRRSDLVLITKKLLSSAYAESLRQVLFDIRAGNSNLAKSLGEKRNHGMYQDENPHRACYPCKVN